VTIDPVTTLQPMYRYGELTSQNTTIRYHGHEIRPPFCGYDMAKRVELRSEDLWCYFNKIQFRWFYKKSLSVWSLACQQCVYFSDITVANISESFTHKMAAKASWHRNYVTVTLCIASATGSSRSIARRQLLCWTWSLYFVLYLVCIYACAVVFLCRYRIFGE